MLFKLVIRAVAVVPFPQFICTLYALVPVVQKTSNDSVEQPLVQEIAAATYHY